MLSVQKFLKEKGIEELQKTYAIKTNTKDNLTIYNYDQIDSRPKNHPIIKNCRGLVLDENFDIVAKGFDRFFNLGEEQDNKFNWNKFYTQKKIDGSLILLYNYKGSWKVNTRGTFGDGYPNNSKLTWKELVLKEINLNLLCPLTTYICEYVSPVSQNVIYYDVPKLYCLSCFQGKTELEFEDYIKLAEKARLNIPEVFNFSNIQQCIDHVNNLKYLQELDEGLVIRDLDNNRLKIKNEKYLLCHHLNDNGNIYLTKNILSLIIIGEIDEVLATLNKPSLVDKKNEVERWYKQETKLIEETWEKYKHIKDQKEFALSIKGFTYSSLLFNLKKFPNIPLSEQYIKFTNKFIERCPC